LSPSTEAGYTLAVRVTQKDIARVLGISLVTVSRALNGKGYVSEEMRRRVQDYARQNHYLPHRASQVLVRHKTRRLALFSSSLPTYFWDELRKGVAAAGEQLRAFDFEVQYHSIPDFDTEAYLRRLRAELASGLDALALVNQPIFDMDAVHALLRESGVPYVTFNVDAPGRRGLCYIGSDYVAGGRLAAEVIGTALRFCSDPKVLVIADNEIERKDPARANLNADRLAGFLDLARSRFPALRCEIRYVETGLRDEAESEYLAELLLARKGEARAVYLIPAINPQFMDALGKADYRDSVNVVHDLDTSALHHLDTHLLTAVIHQNPALQGYYTVKTLERIVEAGLREPLEPVMIASSAVFAENKEIARNLFDLLG
jgi:LacI family transcriptional regulator